MARETKVGLIVGLGLILFVSMMVSEYFVDTSDKQALGADNLPNFHEQTTNQPEMQLTRDTDPVLVPGPPQPIDTTQLAAVSLEQVEQRHGPPSYTGNLTQQPAVPPWREGTPQLPGQVIDNTPNAFQPLADNPGAARITGPVGVTPRVSGIDSPGYARQHQIDPERLGPAIDPHEALTHVPIQPEQPRINRQPAQTEHRVKAGENLTKIARTYFDGDGNMWRSIRDANPGKVGPNGEVEIDALLIIPRRSTDGADQGPGQLTSGSDANARKLRTRVRMIEVKEGDSLSKLAQQHLGSAGKWRLIMDVNTDKLEKPEQLRAGMKLRIPADPVVELVEEANNALANGNTPAGEQPTTGPKQYKVKPGDSLFRIAEKLLGDGERFNEIYKANKDKLSSADDIRVGMMLKVPAR